MNIKNPISRRHYSRLAALIAPFTLCLSLLATGCSKHTADGVEVWGSVTWGGKPVPSGIVTFTADTSKGNSGHQGWAIIKDGRFDTRWDKGRFAPKGACVVTINDKQPSTDPAHPKGTDLILKYDQSVEIPAESAEMNLEVPQSHEAIVSLPDGAE